MVLAVVVSPGGGIDVPGRLVTVPVPPPPPVLVGGVLGGVELVVVGGAVAQVGAVITLVSRFTAAVAASSRPVTVAPVCAVIEECASTVPTNRVPVPRVAEERTCQKTLHEAWAVVNLTTLPDAVIRVLEAWKMNTASGSVRLSRVRVPVRLRLP